MISRTFLFFRIFVINGLKLYKSYIKYIKHKQSIKII